MAQQRQMLSQLRSLMIFCIFFFFVVDFHGSSAAVLAPLRQERSSRLYSLSLYTRTPFQVTNFLLDLGGSFSWIDCTRNYTSSTYHSLPCTSSVCHALGSSHVCSNNSCFFSFGKSLGGKRKGVVKIQKAPALVDSLALPNTTGRNPSRHLSTVPEFVFSCSDFFFQGAHGHRHYHHHSHNRGHLKGATGLVGLGQSNFSLIAQLSAAFSFPRVFALCLSGSPSAPGVAFFGTRGPYFFHHETDLSRNLTYTPLFTREDHQAAGSASFTRLSDEYFIHLTAIKVNGKVLKFDGMNMNYAKKDFHRAMLSTRTPYTTLHSSVYKPLVKAFVKEFSALNLTVTQPVKPFSVCYDVSDVSSSRLGPMAPTVDFVMQSKDVFWRVHGSNSLVRIAEGVVDVWCLAFVDGGIKTRTQVVIGGHQMVDNLLQFDLEYKRLGFSSSVLVQNSMCANFNFTVNHNLI